MAILIECPTLELKIVLELTEDEAMALDALAGYGTDSFLQTFYELMGRAYLEPHEAGLRSLFTAVREVIPNYRNRAQEARKIFDGKKIREGK